MKQVFQKMSSGKITVNDVPAPLLSDQCVLVRNFVSSISVGTEKNKIVIGKKNLFQKALARPDLVEQVIKKIKSEGFYKTINTIDTRLKNPAAMGYSSAGEVIAVGAHVEGIQPGDRVACGGAGFANHSEIVLVPKNLIAKIPENVSFEEASFTTIGSICLHGVRLAKPKIGETFLIIGLGLLGQITTQILKANGCEVLSYDLDKDLVKKSETYGAKGIYIHEDLEKICYELTNSYGVDGVIVCAGSKSNNIIEMSGRALRSKGRIVIVGDIKADLPRENFFKKEINVIVSRSYGPGRYDNNYEINGNDYPIDYVRFTEKRNFETFLSLLSKNIIDIKSLITYQFNIKDATKAYELISSNKVRKILGVIFKYDTQSKLKKTKIILNKPKIKKINNNLKISFIGSGNYATGTLFPILRNIKKLEFDGIYSSKGINSELIAKKMEINFSTDNVNKLLNSKVDAIFITTHHNSHAHYVCEALKSKKNVYVEKPLALNYDDLKMVYRQYLKSDDCTLMVGFNRRFSPAVSEVKNFFKNISNGLIVNIRVNAGEIPPDHWIQEPSIGGGRLIGEGCHFIDLASAIVSSKISKVYAVALNKNNKSIILNDNYSISLSFENGSIANIIYTSEGSNKASKEYIEIFGGGKIAIIDDFKNLFLFNKTQKNTIRYKNQDKGQSAMLNFWSSSLTSGNPDFDFDSIINVSLATIKAVESIMIGEPIKISNSF